MCKPLLTCAIPTWRSEKILWLQLESLARQEEAPPFEVIVMEEPSEGEAGRDYVESYRAALYRAGCVALEYVALDEWTPLPMKWKAIAERSEAPYYLLCASDNYWPPDRLEKSYRHLKEGHQWFDYSTGLFLDLNTGAFGLYRRPGHRTGLFMATRTEMVRSLPPSGAKSGIDAWMRGNMKIHRLYEEPGPGGLHTDGRNNISYDRARHYNRGNARRPFEATRHRWVDFVPEDIATRLKNMML